MGRRSSSSTPGSRNADRLELELPNAERAVIPGAAHLPPLERPDEFDRVVLGFLGRVREA